MVELAGAFVDEYQGPRPAGSQHVDQDSQQQAEHESRQQKGQCVCVPEHSRIHLTTAEGLDMPSVVKIDESSTATPRAPNQP